MILHLELPPAAAARLTAEAQKSNLSLENYALNRLLTLPEPEPPAEETAGEAILRLSRETFGRLSPEELAQMPPDLATNLDHYIHGAAKGKE